MIEDYGEWEDEDYEYVLGRQWQPLTDDEKEALNSIPDDAVSHWFRGEKWDFKAKVWIPK